jgi:hypothetical protein
VAASPQQPLATGPPQYRIPVSVPFWLSFLKTCQNFWNRYCHNFWNRHALMYYFIFYQSKLIPRWLSGWGFIAAALCITSSMIVMFRLISPMSLTQIVLNLPIALQEMVLAVWLIMKGFNSSVIASQMPKEA